jgi:hypothetical protein
VSESSESDKNASSFSRFKSRGLTETSAPNASSTGTVRKSSGTSEFWSVPTTDDLARAHSSTGTEEPLSSAETSVRVGLSAPQEAQTSIILNPKLLEERLVPDCIPDARTEFALDDGKFINLYFILAERIHASFSLVTLTTSELLLFVCAMCV